MSEIPVTVEMVETEATEDKPDTLDIQRLKITDIEAIKELKTFKQGIH